MHALSYVKEPLPKKWLQSALLHGALLLCAVLYHLHSYGSLHFSANRFDKTGTSALTILSDHNIDFLEVSFEQNETAEPQQPPPKLPEEAIDSSTDTPRDSLIDMPLDSLIDAPLDSLIDIPLDSLIDAPLDSLIDIPLDVQIETPIDKPRQRLIAAPLTAPKDVSPDPATHTTKNITTKAEAAKAAQSAVLSVVPEKQAVTSKSSLPRATPAPGRSTQASTQPTSRATPSRSHVAVKPPQTARPDYAHSPKPAYPLALRDLGVSGVVWLRVWVDQTGCPREIELAKGSGYRLFDEAALRAVRHWRFIPAKNEQQSFASWVEFAVRFEING